MKYCKKCGIEKSITEFNRDPTRRDGRHPYCRSCKSSIHAEWRAANPEKIAEKDAARYIANREKIIATNAAWYAENRDKAISARAAWYASNREKMAAHGAAWRAANPDACRIHHQNRRARKRSNGGRLSPDIADRLFKLQRGKCACCGNPLGNDYHLDHIMPLALGGTNTDGNMQLLTAKCNLQKNAKHPVDFMRSKGFLL